MEGDPWLLELHSEGIAGITWYLPYGQNLRKFFFLPYNSLLVALTNTMTKNIRVGKGLFGLQLQSLTEGSQGRD